MITAVKPWLKSLLNAAGMIQVYTEAEDEARIKGAKYAWIYGVDPERIEKDGHTVAVKASHYYLREYELRTRIGVRVAARDEAEASALKTAILNAVATQANPLDPQGFDIEIEVLSAELVTDKSALKTGAGYDLVLEAAGGIYQPSDPSLIDPWLPVLAAWTTEALGAPWRAFDAYPMGQPDHTLYWKITSLEVEEKGRAHFLVRKKLTARIFAQSGQTTWAAVKIAEALEHAYKIPLSVALKKYVTVVAPEANLNNENQVSVILTHNTTRPAEEFPLMGRFYPAGELMKEA